MNTTNQEQIEYWDKRAGPTWVDMQEPLDALLEPLSAAGLRAADAQPGERGVAERRQQPPGRSADGVADATLPRDGHAVSPLRRRRHRNLVRVLAPAGGGRRGRQKRDSAVLGGVPEKLPQNARR